MSKEQKEQKGLSTKETKGKSKKEKKLSPAERLHAIQRAFRELRRPTKHFHPVCPIDKVPMKRKGKKGRGSWWRCPKCRGRMGRDQKFLEPPNKDTLDMRNHQFMNLRNEIAMRKEIVRRKKDKYFPYSEIEWNGEYHDIGEYDLEGISYIERQQMKDAEKERKAKAKKAKKEAAKNPLGLNPSGQVEKNV